MNKRNFIKSLFATGALALVLAKLFAQEKKQSTINGIPTKITKVNISYTSSPSVKSFGEGLYASQTTETMRVELGIVGRVYHNIYDKLKVTYYVDGVKCVEFTGVVYGTDVKSNTTSIFLENCVKQIRWERCMVV